MLISDVLRTKGHHVERIHPTDSIELAVRKLAEHRIGALVVEDRSGSSRSGTSSMRSRETAPPYSAFKSNN